MAYAGSFCYGFYGYTGANNILSDNIFIGLTFAVRPMTSTIGLLGAGAVMSGNSAYQCLVGFPTLQAEGLTVTGNSASKCVNPFLLGPGSSNSFPNRSSSPPTRRPIAAMPLARCKSPWRAPAAQSQPARAHRSRGRAALCLAQRHGADIQRGRHADLTAAAAMGATTLTGTVAGASITGSETASVALVTGVIRRTGSTSASIGSGVSVAVRETPFYLPSGTVLMFSGAAR
jgi:hypothetical protein